MDYRITPYPQYAELTNMRPPIYKIGRLFRKPLHPTYRPINIAMWGYGAKDIVVAPYGAGVYFANTGLELMSFLHAD